MRRDTEIVVRIFPVSREWNKDKVVVAAAPPTFLFLLRAFYCVPPSFSLLSLGVDATNEI